MVIAARLYRDSRWAERHAVELDATLRDRAQQPNDVAVEDLSNGGFRISTQLDLWAGDEIALGIAGIGTRAAHVVWGDGTSFGCEFDAPLSDAELRTALAAPAVEPIAFPGAATPAPSASENPADESKFSPRVRLAIIAAGAVLGWVAVIALGWGAVTAVRALIG